MELLRSCEVKGRNARFHTWEHVSKPVEPSPMVGRAPGGTIAYTIAIVEYEDGTIGKCYATDIKFTDVAPSASRKPVARFEKVSLEEWLKNNGHLNNAKELWENIKLPKRATTGSAGYDFFYPAVGGTWMPNEEYVVDTGVKVFIEQGWALITLPKSGLGTKYKTTLNNTAGLIDSDYYGTGKAIISMWQVEEAMLIRQGQAFMQAMLIPYGVAEEETVQEVRTGGHGSTEQGEW